MSYVKTTWHTGDVVTSAKLNNMEDGIANAGGYLYAELSYDDSTSTYSCNKTNAELYEAWQNGANIGLREGNEEDGYTYLGLLRMTPYSAEFIALSPDESTAAFTHVMIMTYEDTQSVTYTVNDLAYAGG